MPEATANSSLIRELPGTSIPAGITVLDYDFKNARDFDIKFTYGDTSRPIVIRFHGNPVTSSLAAWKEGYDHVHNALRKDTNVAAAGEMLGISHMTHLVEAHLDQMDVKVRSKTVIPEALDAAFAAILPDGFEWHGGDGGIARGYIIADSDMGARWASPLPLAIHAAHAAAVAAEERSR
jgi:hypothetical protein